MTHLKSAKAVLVKKLLVLALGLVSAFIPERGRAADRPAPLVIAAGEVAGFYYPTAGALCRVLNKDKVQGRTCLVQPTTGSSANITAIGAGDAELGLVQSRAAMLAAGSGEGFQGVPVRNLRAVLSLYGEAVLVMVRPEAQIVQLADLKGKRVNLGKVGSFQRAMADTLLSAAKLSEGDLAQVVELDLDAQAQALCDGNLDAAFFSGVHPMTEVMGAIDQCGAVPLSIPTTVIQASEAKQPWLSKLVIPGNAYDGIKDDVTTMAVRTLLVTTEQAPSDQIYDLVKAIHGNFGAFTRQHPVLANLNKEDTAKAGVAIPLHDGARRFFAEQGYLK